MIRWTKDGKVDRTYFLGSFSKGGSARESNDLADALDVAVAALRIIRDSPGAYRDSEQIEAAKALRQIGADHAD